jgi:hypothetical protein
MPPAEQEIPYKPAMDRANNVTRDRWIYDPTEFLNDPESLAEVEQKSWPSRVGIFGLVLIAISGFFAPLASSGAGTGIALAGIFSGWSTFAMANYLAYRLGERVWLQPDTAGRVVVAGFFLTLTSLVAAFIN